MSFVYDPAVPEDDASYIGKFAAATNVNYDRRALHFTICTVVFSLVSIAVSFLLPFAFLFAFLGARNTQQAQDTRYVLQRPKWLDILHWLPLAVLIAFIGYCAYALSQDKGGWAWLGIILLAMFSIPGIIISNIVAYFTVRRLRFKDGLAAYEEPRNKLLFTYKALGLLSLLIPVGGLFLGFGMGF